MSEHQVIIVGGGPTGMMLAAELKIAGVEPVILERRLEPELPGSRAGGLHARTLEVLDQRGVVDRFLAAGTVMQVNGFGPVRLDISDFPSRHPYGLALFQNAIERIFRDWLAELGITTRRGVEVAAVVQDDDAVTLTLADGGTLCAAYVIGCDGGRSLVRKQAGIAFPGTGPTVSHILAEAELADPPELGARTDAIGLHGLSPLEGGKVRIMVTDRTPITSREVPTLADLGAGLVAHYGRDFGVHSPTWITRFTDAARQAAQYRTGRILLAGDAAHIHYPAGGQGLGTGVQDAVNLGWKLAQVVRGQSPETLLDSYHAERHPVGARVLRNTLAAVAMNRTDDRSLALREVVADLLATDEGRKRLAGELSGLDIRYDLGPGHPLLGRRMPDLGLDTSGGATRVYALPRDARPLLLDFAGTFPDHRAVIRVPCITQGPWDLPVTGAVAAPSAVLVRPDGHVAWVGEGTADGLDAAIARWFGA